MGKIKLVVFDLEHTLFDWNYCVKKLGNKNKLSETQIKEYFLSKLPLLETDKLTSQEFWTEFISLNNLSLSSEELSKNFFKFLPIQKISWEFAKGLKKLDYKIAICSTAWPGSIISLKKLFPDFEIFDYIFDMFLIGHKKPKKDFYKHIEESTGFKGREILLVDDTEKDLADADYFGWRTINIHDSTDNLKPSFIKNL